MEKKERIIKTWEECSLFENIPVDTEYSFLKNFHRGDIISEEQGGIKCIGIIVSGRIIESGMSGENRQNSVSVYNEGDIFGIYNVFLDDQSIGILECRVRTSVIFLPKLIFKKLLFEHPKLLMKYLVLCNKKIMNFAEKIELTSIISCKSRITRYFIKKADVNGYILLDISKEQLASYLNISKASFFRIFSELKSEGLIDEEHGKIHITDMQKMKEISE